MKELARRNQLISITTKRREIRFPAFQFRNGVPLPGMDAVLVVFYQAQADRWVVASWFQAGQPELHSCRPSQPLGVWWQDFRPEPDSSAPRYFLRAR